MATLKYEEMVLLAEICVEHMKSDLSPQAHIKDRAHFGTEEEVIERMRYEKKLVISSFNGYMTEEKVCEVIRENLLWDCESAEAETLGYNKTTGRTRCTGHIIMAPLDEEEQPIETGFAIFYDTFEKKHSSPKTCKKIKVCIAWEEFEDGSICKPMFSIESIYPIR